MAAALDQETLRREALPLPWLASRLGLPPERLEAMRRAGELLVVRTGRGQEFAPVWQLDADGRPLEVVQQLVAAARAGGVDDETLYTLLLRRSGLGGPRLCDLLRAGEEVFVLGAIRDAVRERRPGAR